MTAEPARLTAPWLDDPALATAFALLGPGQARLVGGAVRDGLLGRPVQDIDLATVHRPQRVQALAQGAGVKAVPTGLAHGTVTLIIGGRPFEVTTLRRDVETDGRHAVVAFTEDWQADAARRDFTMNALYADPDGAVHDYFGGAADAAAGRVRFIGAPLERLREDALRLYRFVRFHGHYGRGAPDRDGAAACEQAVAWTARLSIERIRDELLKLLTGPDPGTGLALLWGWGALARVYDARPDLARLALTLAGEAAAGLTADPVRRLAATVPGQAAAKRIGEALKLSNAEKARLVAAQGDQPAGLAEAAYRLGRQTVADRLLLHRGPEAAPALAELAALQVPRFPLKGADLLAQGVPAGEAVGRALAEAERIWIASGFTRSRDALLADALAAVWKGTAARGD